MSEAVLGFKIDSSQATGAAADLDRLTASAARTQAAADKLEAEASGLGAALGRAGDGASKAKPAVDNLGKSFGAQDEHVRAFRMEVERLTLKYQPLAQATKQYEATVAEIGRAHKVGAISAQQMTTALDAERLAFERLKTSATTAGAAVKAANANRPTGGGSFQTANVAAQFQDIAVTSAMGMSPLQIALQQGTQLSSVLGPMGAAGAVKGLGAAFASLISPVSLVTLGLVAGAAALIQYGYAWFEGGGDDISGDLEKQADLLSTVAERWGDLVPSVKEYADELTRAKEQADLLAGIDIVNQRKLEGTQSGLSAASISVADLVNQLQSAGEESDVILDLQNAVNQFNKSAAEGTLKIGEVTSVQDALSAALRSTGIPAIADFRSEFEKLSDSALKSSKDVSESWREVAAALTSRFPSQGAYDGVERSADGRIMGERFPFQSQTPTSRPSREGDLPDPANILNSDGRLVGVPIPGQKPNQFELEKEAEAVDDVTKAYRRAQEAQADFWLDLSFQERQATRSATDQKIASTLTRYGFNENLQSPEANALRQQIRGEEAKGLFKDFFNGAYQEAWSNGGKIGDALGKSALNAAQKATEKAWDAIFDKLATGLSNWLTGKSGGASASAAPGVVSNLLGTAANDNKGFAAPVGAVARAPLGDIASYAASIRKIESGSLEGNYGALGPVTRNGDRAYGAYQVMGNNIGPWSKEALGKSMTASEFLTDKGAQDAIFNHKFGGYAEKYGAGGAAQAWFGGPGSVGKGGMGTDILGTSGNAYVQKFEANVGKLGDVASAATEGVSQLGGGLSKLGSSLGGMQLSPGSGSAVGQYGGLWGGIGKLFGGISPTSPLWAPNTTLGGFLGANANGTDNWRGGLSMVGERGPELLNLPQGAGVVSNHKLMSALAANNNGGQGGGIAGIRLFVEKDGNWNAKVVSLAKGPAKQASAQAVGQYSKQQTRGGFGDTQSVYASDKG
jgi:hypothetical protein